ncbi:MULTISPECIES: hypothetical protein [unclassified Mesorhizobium]|uniref:hypothetical protein n=1 Tax=unclassified Mesorhizobium TaxID=325217 RepID=UPI001FDF48DD|nr:MULTISPECIES: hypothetical protein [unclassified Mesorhizobium]
MSTIVTRTDCAPPAKAVSGTAGRTFGPNHRWKVLGIGVAANAGFSATFSGVPATAVVMRQGYQLDNASLGLALGLLGAWRSANCPGACSPIAGATAACC